MQGKTLTIIAVVLFALALVVGFYGLRIGKEPVDVPQVALPTHKVWRFDDDYPPGKVLENNMLEETEVTNTEIGDVEDASVVLGRVLGSSVKEGQRLQSSQLAPERPLLDQLPAGQRAIAIKVDEVTAVGGHLQAGDRVDVLFYLRANRESGDISSARRLFSGLKVLAYGDETIGEKSINVGDRKARERSAVLAVPEPLVPELLLAASTGDLRLSVMGLQEPEMPVTLTSAQAVAPPVTMASFSASATKAPVTAQTPAPESSTTKTTTTTPAARKPVQKASSPGLEVLLGEERVTMKP
ncbi:Flp pilus assembly protein CpaB [Pokkaliibacter sp. CJK22405]|uniref:Flp pilus assembly protein CpaB n=1 Tax=Pokkaliibacter sp. CJK22405 TaxID=3384615 RepID=UPI003984CD04